jgi:hypothetical protein
MLGNAKRGALGSSVLLKLIFLLGALEILAVRIHGQPLSWVLLTNHAAWFARDSAGEVAVQNKLWIFGGWVNSFEEGPRDVWQSTDGLDWALATPKAPWLHGDLSTTLAFQDKMWNIGGWFAGRLTNASATSGVWFSEDGANWQAATETAPWFPRLGAAGAVFQDRIWILGGVKKYYYGTDDDLLNDVWSSKDGTNWVQETSAAAWRARAYHQVLALNGRLWLFGGGNYVPNYQALNDVWSSRDGVTWTRILEHAPWPERIWFSAAVYRDRMWVLGGWSNNPYQNWGDVWFSRNGIDWNELKTSTTWPPRHELSSFVLRDKLWVAGGFMNPVANDVWQIDIPVSWFDNNIGITWNSRTDAQYQIETKAVLTEPWAPLGNSFSGAGRNMSYSLRIDNSARFYRISALAGTAGGDVIKAVAHRY